MAVISIVVFVLLMKLVFPDILKPK